MTVSYNAEVATSRKFGCFLKLLLRWRGSIYKLIWMDLLLFLVLYYGLSLVYRFALNENQKYVFESIVYYCNSHVSLIPLSFVLGFYVAIVMQRWWKQYMTIPWPDPIAVYVSALVRGQDERGRVMRRTIMRYVCLSITMMLTLISQNVKKRFRTLDQMVEAGLLLESEKKIIMAMDEKFPKHPTHWMPIVWAASIATRARFEGRIWDDFSLRSIIDELNTFRSSCGSLLHYDWISIPLVYTQVVTLAVYTYFLGAVLGNQWTDKPDKDGFYNFMDHYFPVFSTLQFFFYMGWLKVAESLINPFGDDDDDYELNWMIDRNLPVCYLIVDEMHHDHPELVKDQYWDEVFPNELPYPELWQVMRDGPPTYSTAKYEPKSNVAPSAAEENISDVETASVRGQSNAGFRKNLQNLLQHLSASVIDLLSGNRLHRTSSRLRLSVASGESSSSGDSEVSLTTTQYSDSERRKIDADKILRKTARRLSKEKAKESEPQPEPDPQPESETNAEVDEFEELRKERERQRLARHRQLFAPSGVSTPRGTPSQPTSRAVSFVQPPKEEEEEKKGNKSNKK